MTFEPLTDRDYQRLADTLACFQDQDCMNLERLDGFFTALLCGPMPLQPAECLPVILGRAFDDEDAFPTERALENFANLLLRHWLDIRHTLEAGEPFHPWLDAGEDGLFHGNDWALGFVDGMQLMYDDWQPLLDDPQQASLLEPVMALAFEHDPDETLRTYLEEADPEQRAGWLAAITPAVAGVHAYFARMREEIELDTDND